MYNQGQQNFLRNYNFSYYSPPKLLQNYSKVTLRIIFLFLGTVEMNKVQIVKYSVNNLKTVLLVFCVVRDFDM